MIARERLLSALLILLFVAGGVLGGGPTSPILSMFVELIACALAAVALAGLLNGECPRQATAALILLLLICAVPIVQLIPLPVSYWTALPGRALPETISKLVGLGDLARPLSLAPEQTRLAALSLIVPAAALLATLQLTARSRDHVMTAIVLFAIVSAMLGLFQVAAGGGIGLGIYPYVHDGLPIGFFANRNHEADLLLIAIPLSARLVRSQRWRHRTRLWTIASLAFFFSLSVLATQSRTALSLLPVALYGGFFVWVDDLRDRRLVFGGIGLITILAAGYVLVNFTPVGHHALGRFNDVGDDMRPQFWRGTMEAIKAFWPAGSGTGSFVPVYATFEDLDSVNSAWVNHAHNDYLELLLDTGIAGAVLMATYALVALAALLRTLPRPIRGQRYAAVAGIIILLAHSATDYPLRTFGLLTIFAVLNGLLFPSRDAGRMLRSASLPANARHPLSPDESTAGSFTARSGAHGNGL